jgi:hypothetical protein
MDTFVVRLYSERPEDRPVCLRGVVEEIATGYRATFRGSAELLAILRRPHHETRAVPPEPNVMSGSGGHVH